MGNAGIKKKHWIKFLMSRGCIDVKGTNHIKYKCPNCLRPIIFQNGKEIPQFQVKNNLKEMGVSFEDFLTWVSKNC